MCPQNVSAQTDALSAAIRQMFQVQKALHDVFPKKAFTPDGRIIGDIGEAIAEISYQVTIDPGMRKQWDGKREEVGAECPEVQVRAKQKEVTYVKQSPHKGCLLVLKILPDGTWECCYNGNTDRVWRSLEAKKANRVGEKLIGLDALRKLDKIVGDGERIALR